MQLLEMYKEPVMAKSKIKVEVNIRNWKTAMLIGFLFGVVVAAAPQYIGLLIMATLSMGVIVLLSKGRI
jgi:hypothetical protein